LAAPKFTTKVDQDFGKNADLLKSYVQQFNRKALVEKVQKEGGVKVNVDNTECLLKHKEHFFIDARDMLNKQ